MKTNISKVSPGISIGDNVRCFLSHVCGYDREEHHTFGRFLQVIFNTHRIEILIDPFGPGVEVGARIRTINFHAFLFLSCQESLESFWCQEELKAARRRSVPIFVVRWKDRIPEDLQRGRIFLDRFGLNDTQLIQEAHRMADEIWVRARLYKRMQCLLADSPPEILREVAQSLADEENTTALEEFIEPLSSVYRLEMDPVARYWIALALGKTGSARAKEILESWQSHSDQPLPQEGIREALEMLCGHNT